MTKLAWYYKMAGFLRMQYWLPIYVFAKGNRFTNWLFGVNTSADKAVLQRVFDRLERDFLYWALNAVLNWHKNEKPTNMIRIHGTADLVLPLRKNTDYDWTIEKGTHLMLLDKSEEVSKAIINALK